jgi:hypothetical protein
MRRLPTFSLVLVRSFALATLAAAVALTGCATPSLQTQPPPVAAATPADQVHVTINSWGRPVFDWTLNADGSGVYKASHRGSKSFTDYVVETRRLDPAAGRFDQVTALLKMAEAYGGKTLPCKLEITDMPYGTVSWRREGVVRELPIQVGCTSPQADAVYEQIRAADTLAAGWAKDAPVIDQAAVVAKPGL